MKKRIIGFFTAFVVILNCFQITVNSTEKAESDYNAKLYLSADKEKPQPGDTVTVTFSLMNDYCLGSVNVMLAYDKNYYEKPGNFTLIDKNSPGISMMYAAQELLNESQADNMYPSYYPDEMKEKYNLIKISMIWRLQTVIDHGLSDAPSTVYDTKTRLVSFTLDVKSTAPDDGYGIILIDPIFQMTADNHSEAKSSTYISRRGDTVSTGVIATYGQTLDFSEAVLYKEPDYCTHSEDNYQWITVTPVSCTTDGYSECYCKICNSLITTKSVTATGHTPGEAATCTKNQICTVCKEVIKKATGHNYIGKTTPPTCTEDGYTTYTCSKCTESYISDYVTKNGHTPGEKATCTENQICTVCKTVLVSAKGHTPGDLPTCTTPQICAVCREVLEKPLGHNYKSEYHEATCTKPGYTKYTCTRCPDTYSVNSGSPKGHSEDSGTVTEDRTCTKDGKKVYKCTVCREILREEVLKKTGHNYSKTVTKPTCTEKGFTTYYCLNCHDTYYDDIVSQKGHKESDWITVTEPTKQSEGSRQKICEICFQTLETETIEKLNPSVNSISVENITAYVNIDKEVTPIIDIDPGVSYDIIYVSENDFIVSVDNKGIIYPMSKGETNITCTVTDQYGKTLSCEFSVTVIDAADLLKVTKEDFVLDNEEKIIYGVEEGSTSLESYLEYENCQLEYNQTLNGFGTGTEVNIIYDDDIVETFTIVIFGDVNGDGVIDNFDLANLFSVGNCETEYEEYSPLFYAGDINFDGAVDLFDAAIVAQIGNGELQFKQAKN